MSEKFHSLSLDAFLTYSHSQVWLTVFQLSVSVMVTSFKALLTARTRSDSTQLVELSRISPHLWGYRCDARPVRCRTTTIIFSLADYHRPLAIARLYCTATEAHVFEQPGRGSCHESGATKNSNWQPVDCDSSALPRGPTVLHVMP